jgi:hypothetical protein
MRYLLFPDTPFEMSSVQTVKVNWFVQSKMKCRHAMIANIFIEKLSQQCN